MAARADVISLDDHSKIRALEEALSVDFSPREEAMLRGGHVTRDGQTFFIETPHQNYMGIEVWLERRIDGQGGITAKFAPQCGGDVCVGEKGTLSAWEGNAGRDMRALLTISDCQRTMYDDRVNELRQKLGLTPCKSFPVPDPVPDMDGDGISINDDRCPNDAEDMNGIEDEDGCPEMLSNLDYDSDSIDNGEDNCPTEAGGAEYQGCRTTQFVRLEKNSWGLSVDFLEEIHFRKGSGNIEVAMKRVLDNLAAVLLAHPEIVKLQIQGHTDNRGGDEANLRLSQKRAEAVADYLVDKGVSRDRLETVGYGSAQPVADNHTAEGREMNRRIDVEILAPSSETSLSR